MAVKKLLGFLDSLFVIVADKRLKPDKVTVNSNGVDSILCHGLTLTQAQAPSTYSHRLLPRVER
jgi:hypothetical protein